MNSYQADRVDPHQVSLNQEIVQGYVDELYYKRSYAPGMFVLSGSTLGTAGQSVGLLKWPTIDYPDAVTSHAVIGFERPAFWQSGKIQITVYYTSPTAGTANFSIQLAVYSVPRLGNLSTTGVAVLLATTTVAAPGPAVIDGEQSIVTYTTTSFNPAAARIGLRVSRDGAGDANNNVLQVTEVVIRHIPVA